VKSHAVLKSLQRRQKQRSQCLRCPAAQARVVPVAIDALTRA
jgi:hypothetical protein